MSPYQCNKTNEQRDEKKQPFLTVEYQLIVVEGMVEVGMYCFIVNLLILMDVYVGECSCL